MRSIEEAVAWGEAQAKHPSQDWSGMCESFTRQCLGLPAYAASAKIAAEKVPADQRHTSTPPPRGAMVFFEAIGGQYGHAVLSIGGGKVLSTDYCVKGHVCEAAWDLPNWHATKGAWFWTMWTPFGVIK